MRSSTTARGVCDREALDAPELVPRLPSGGDVDGIERGRPAAAGHRLSSLEHLRHLRPQQHVVQLEAVGDELRRGGQPIADTADRRDRLEHGDPVLEQRRNREARVPVVGRVT